MRKALAAAARSSSGFSADNGVVFPATKKSYGDSPPSPPCPTDVPYGPAGMIGDVSRRSALRFPTPPPGDESFGDTSACVAAATAAATAPGLAMVPLVIPGVPPLAPATSPGVPLGPPLGDGVKAGEPSRLPNPKNPRLGVDADARAAAACAFIADSWIPSTAAFASLAASSNAALPSETVLASSGSLSTSSAPAPSAASRSSRASRSLASSSRAAAISSEARR